MHFCIRRVPNNRDKHENNFCCPFNGLESLINTIKNNKHSLFTLRTKKPLFLQENITKTIIVRPK